MLKERFTDSLSIRLNIQKWMIQNPSPVQEKRIILRPRDTCTLDKLIPQPIPPFTLTLPSVKRTEWEDSKDVNQFFKQTCLLTWINSCTEPADVVSDRKMMALELGGQCFRFSTLIALLSLMYFCISFMAIWSTAFKSCWSLYERLTLWQCSWFTALISTKNLQNEWLLINLDHFIGFDEDIRACQKTMYQAFWN